MKTIRPPAVSAAFLAQANDAYIVISSTTIEAEITAFLKALSYSKIGSIEPDNDMQFLSLAEALESLLVESVVPPHSVALKKQLSCLSPPHQRLLVFRLHQLKTLIQSQSQTQSSDTYLVSPAWNRRWFDLIAGRVLHADVIYLDVDAFQP